MRTTSADNIQFRAAEAADAESLTELTMQSKNHWNYGEAQIAAWRDELTITPEYIRKNHVWLAEQGTTLVGYYSGYETSSRALHLDNLFIAPLLIGKGHGQRLLDHLTSQAIQWGHEKITLDADPHAEGFYLRNGFIVTGRLETSIKDRFLPVMEKSLTSGPSEPAERKAD